MSVELTNKEDSNVIKPYHMKDGQIGIITTTECGHLGKIVQKYGDVLIAIGKGVGSTWSVLSNEGTMRVRLLKPGETITITSN